MVNLKKENKIKMSKISIILLIFLVVFLIILIIYLFASLTSKKVSKISIKNDENKKEYIFIPEGFYYVGGTIETGVVISDNEEDTDKGNEYETALELKGNQYVWIPVEYPIAEDNIQLTSMVEKGNYPLAIKDGNNYKGVLYTLSSESGKVKFEIYTGDDKNKDNEEISNREPAILKMSTYGDSDDFISNSTESLYQDKFNQMVNSVKKYKGFFVSRYELGNLHQEKFVSKANQEDISNICWTEGYKGIEKMYDGKEVSSEMIWGCQWDAIMIWIYNSSDNQLYFRENTDDVCNRTGGILKTSSKKEYFVKNISDLIGNVFEFTQEASYSSNRIARGGSFDYESNVNSNNMMIRKALGIFYPYNNVGYRSTLIF